MQKKADLIYKCLSLLESTGDLNTLPYEEMQWNTWVSIIPSVDAVDVAKNFSGPPHVFLLSLGWAEEDLYTLLLLHFHTSLLCSDLQHNTQYNDIQEKYCVRYDVLSALCIEPGKDMLFDWYTFPHFFRI